MKLIYRLYLKDFLKLLCLISVGLSVIFSLIDLIGRIDDFPPGSASADKLVLYAAFNLPKFFIYLLPMSVLICSLFTFSQAFRRGEMTAIKAAGGRIRSVFMPFVITGLLLSLLAFITSEVIVPDFSKKAAVLKTRLEGRDAKSVSENGSIWLKTRDGSPVKIDLYIPDRQVARGIRIFISADHILKQQILAKKGEWNGQEWVLKKVTIHDFETGKRTFQESMTTREIESPELFAKDIRTPDEMGIYELYLHIERLNAAGFRNLKLIVDLNSKISFPLINFFMMLLGISLSARGGRGGGMFSAGLGLLISLVYWFGYTFSLSIGYAGILHPFLAAWLMPLAFGIFSVYLFRKTPE